MNLDSAIFYTNDLEKIKKFYLETVGLTFDYQDGEKFISFKFPNGAKLGIKKSSKERENPGSQTVFLSVDDIEGEYKKYQDLGFEFYEDLKQFDWGKYFAILDPDNNKLALSKTANLLNLRFLATLDSYKLKLQNTEHARTINRIRHSFPI